MKDKKSQIPNFLNELVYCGEKITANDDLINDDTKRENAFMLQALQACVKARTQMSAAKLPFLKPQNISGHSFKTFEKIIEAQKKAEEEVKSLKAAEELRKQRMLKKVAKEVQTKRIQEKNHEKKQAMKRIASIKPTSKAPRKPSSRPSRHNNKRKH